MNSISASSVALSLLQQGSRAGATSSAATDAIMKIVSGMVEAKSAETRKSQAVAYTTMGNVDTDAEGSTDPNVAGSVSPVVSARELSALSRIVVGTVLEKVPAGAANPALASTDEAVERLSDPSWDAAVTDAENRSIALIDTVIGFNGKFHLQNELDLPEVMIKIEQQREKHIAGGMSEERATILAESQIRTAPDFKKIVEIQNSVTVQFSKNVSWLLSARESSLKVGRVVTFDENGKASIKAFDMLSASGEKLASLAADGTFTTYLRDGSTRSQRTKSEMALNSSGADYVLQEKYSSSDFNNLRFY